MTTTVKDFLATAIAAAEQRGYDRAVSELQAVINQITGLAEARSEPTTNANTPQSNANANKLTRSEQLTLDAIRANPGSTIAEIKKRTGLRSVGAAYALTNRGLVRKEGARFAPKGTTANPPRVRFFPV